MMNVSLLKGHLLPGVTRGLIAILFKEGHLIVRNYSSINIFALHS